MNLAIFDCDGVLVDSEAILIDAELEFLETLGLTFDKPAYIRRFMGMSVDEWRASLAELSRERRHEPLTNDSLDELEAFTQVKLRESLVPVAGAKEAIESMTIAICVASSSSPPSLIWKLNDTGLLNLFDPHVFSTHSVKQGKPEPDLFLFASREMGVRASACVVVEDSLNGVTAGKRAGMKVVGFTGGSHCSEGHGESLMANGADVVVDRFSRLAGTVDAM